jgi:predicted tellurium resistance membrane protein TerC
MSARTLGLVAFVVLLALGAVLGVPEHPHFWWEAIPDFYAGFGVAAAVFLVAVVRRLGERLLQRPENYYPDDR